MAEEEKNHEWHSGDREERGDGDEFGGFRGVAAVFDGEETE